MTINIEVQLAENTAEAMRQAGISTTAAASAVAAAESVLSATPANLVPRVMIEGDSIMAGNHAVLSGSNFGQTQAIGELVWAHAQYPYFSLDQWADPGDTVNYSRGLNVAVGGNATLDVIARLATSTNVAPDIVALAIGINDINGGGTASATMAQIETICDYYIGLGKTVLLANLRPVSASYALTDWSNGSTRLTQLLALNTLIANYAAATPNVHLVDLMAAYSNGATPPRPRDGEMGDGLHPNRTGAYVGSQAWLAALRKIVKPITIYRPYTASVVSNPLLTGTGGATGGGVTGPVAVNWFTYAGSYDGSFAGSVAASKNASDQQVLTITPGGEVNEFISYSRGSGGAAMVSGRWYKGVMRVKLNASASKRWRGVWWKFAPSSEAFGPSGTLENAAINSDGDIILHIETPVYQAPADEVGEINSLLVWDGRGGSALVATIMEIYVGEVANPNPLHNF
jgi:lysophospholipase L1-like esterase